MLSKFLRPRRLIRQLNHFQVSLVHDYVDVDTNFQSIAKEMTSIRVHGPKDYRLETIPTPQLQYGEMLVKVGACGICAGDCKCYHGAPLFWQEGVNGKSYCEPPVTPGHEFVGTIVAFADGCDRIYPNLKLGDQVVAEQIVPCGACRYCVSGNVQMCEVHNVFGFRQACQGAMSTYMKYPRGSRVHKISNSVKPEHAAFTEPLACAIHAVHRAEIEENDTVVISGAGAIGMAAIIAAKKKNPKQIIVLDGYDWKLDLAKEMGTDEVFNVMKIDFDSLLFKIKELTNSWGCDKYIELTGNNLSFRQGIHMLRRMGRMSLYSVFGRPVSEKDDIDLTIISDAKELTIQGGHLGPNCWPTAIQWIEDGTVPVEKIVMDNILPLQDWKKGIDMVDKGDQSVKVVLKHEL